MPGKSIDELNLTDQSRTTTQSDLDPRSAEWYRFVPDIDDLLATGRYTFAEDTLRGIQVTVEKSQQVTDGQRRAVKNIEDSRLRSERVGNYSGGWRRRYEGY